MLNIDGVAGSAGNGTSGGGAGSTANKYKTSNASTTDRAMSGVGRGPSVFQTQGIYCIPINIVMIDILSKLKMLRMYYYYLNMFQSPMLRHLLYPI